MFSKIINSDVIRRATRLFKFGTVGISGVVVNTGFLFLFTESFKLDYKISALISIELSIINNYIWNTMWTWSDKKTSTKKNRQFIKFQVSSIFSAYVVNYGILIGLTELLHLPYLLSNMIGIAVGSSLNFLFGHFWVFRKKDSIEEQPEETKGYA